MVREFVAGVLLALRWLVWGCRRCLWRSHELPAELTAELTAERYLTDEVHLYEVVQVRQNHGVIGGRFVTVRDCVDESTRVLSPLEAELCRQVRC